MVFLLLAIASSAMISILMRIGSYKVSSNLSMLSANYLVCMALGAAFAGPQLISTGTPGFSVTAGLGVLNGVLFLAGFILLQTNTRKNGIVLSSIFMKLGLLVPMTLSVLVFREIPTALQGAGFLAAVGAIVLINLKRDARRAGMGAGLLLLLLVGGSADAMVKVFEELGPAALGDAFLFFTFAVAFALCTGLVICKKEHPDKQALFFGVLIGIPNFFSSKFLLWALTDLPAVVVYPTFSVATILLVTLAGVLAFREKLSRLQWIALGVILAALALLNT